MRWIRLGVIFPLDAARRGEKRLPVSPVDDQAFRADGCEECGCLDGCAGVEQGVGGGDVEVAL